MWEYEESGSAHKQFTKVEQLLQHRKYTVFAGHFHNYTKRIRHDRRYITLATTGGASEMRGTIFGEFDHVAWVTMTDEGPRIANLLLEGIEDEDVRTVESTKHVEQLVRDLRVELKNAYVETETYAGGPTTFEVHNATRYPVLIEAAFGPSAPFMPVPHAIEMSVPAGSAQSVPVDLRVERPLATSEMRGIPFRWTARLDGAGRNNKPITLGERFQFIASRVFEMKRRDKAVVVDGRLDEWENLAFDVSRPAQILANDAWTGPDDARYSFEVASDDQNVYVAVNVIDERVVAVKEKPPWEQDGIEMSIDSRDDPQRAANRRDYGQVWETYVYLGFSPASDPKQMSVWEPEKIPQGVQVACVPNATGYAAEIAIPHKVLNRFRGGAGSGAGDWTALRLNIAIRDSDEPDGPNAALWWQPDWHSDANVPGSGTFRRVR
jgi:hypothetical protein